jgi:hypothetical protein
VCRSGKRCVCGGRGGDVDGDDGAIGFRGGGNSSDIVACLNSARHLFDSLCNTQRRYHYMCVVGTIGSCQERLPRRWSAGSKHRPSPRHNSVPPSNTNGLAPPREGRVKTVHPMANIQETYLQVCQSSSRIRTRQKSHRSRIPYTSVGLPEGHSLVISPARQSPTLWDTCRLRLSPS